MWKAIIEWKSFFKSIADANEGIAAKIPEKNMKVIVVMVLWKLGLRNWAFGIVEDSESQFHELPNI